MASTTTSAPAAPAQDILKSVLETAYSWDYRPGRQALADLYRKATRHQWIAEEVLDYSIDVDPEQPNSPEHLHPLYGSRHFERLTPQEHARLNSEMQSWLLSQFLHGEQGALLAASHLVSCVRDHDKRMYAATQVVDEARHVDVFNRYLDEKIGFAYPISPHLKGLLDLILTDSRWDMKCLGMQIIVEGLALAAFGFIRQSSEEPLLTELVKYVIADEARHVAFGVFSLADYFSSLPEAEFREREDFVYEACVLMRDRFLMDEVWEKMGMPVEECKTIVLENTAQQIFRQLLFSKIVPSVKRIGLLSPRQRERFEKLGILHFESAPAPCDEEAEIVGVD